MVIQSICIYFTGVPFRKLKMQALLPQPPEACEAYLDSNVQEATQEGIVQQSSVLHVCSVLVWCLWYLILFLKQYKVDFKVLLVLYAHTFCCHS